MRSIRIYGMTNDRTVRMSRMISTLRHIASLVLLSAVYTYSLAQNASVSASVDRDRILIGEPVKLQLEAFLPAEIEAGWFDLDSIPHFDFVEVARIDTLENKNGRKYSQLVTLTSFDSGRWVIPPMSLEINGKYYVTDSFPVTVAYSDFDPSKPYHDIKDIIEVENPYTRYINWALAAITLLSLFAIIYFLRKKYETIIPPVTEKAIRLAPYDEAIQQLDALQKQQLPESGQAKLYYTRLNDILRGFVEKTRLVKTMQKTSEELVIQVREAGLPGDHLISLAQTLRMSDAVKFAKFIPRPEDNETNFNNVRSSIQLLNNLNS